MAHVSSLERRFRMILHGRSARRLPGPLRATLVVFAALVLPWAAGFTADDAPGDPALKEPPSGPPQNEIRIHLEWDAKGGKTVRRVGKGPPSAPKELLAAIERVKAESPTGDEDFKVIIEAASDVPWEDVVEVLDLARKQTASIEFAAPRRAASKLQAPIPIPGRKEQLRLEADEVTLVGPGGKDVLWKTPLGSQLKPVKVEMDDGGKVIILHGPGKTVAFDVDTGKVIREMTTGLGGKPARPEHTVRPPDAPGALPGAGLNAPIASAGSALDVVQLGSALVEARGALELAKSKLSAMSGLEGVVSKTELIAEEIQLQTAERKIDLLRRIAKSALKGTTMEIEALLKIEDMATKRYEAGQAGEDAVLAATLRRAHAQTLASLLEEILRD
jgi:hypothetical protein